MDADELLPEPRRPGLFRTPARRRIVGVLAATALVAGLAARIVTGGGDDTRPTPSPTRSLLAGPPLSVADDASLFPYDPTVCPIELSCVRSADLPAAVLVALRERAPGARTLRVRTVGVLAHQGVHTRLWFRQVDAEAGTVRIQVIVKKASPDAASAPADTSDRFDGRSIGFVRVNIAAFAISVQFTGPADYRPPMAAIRALAADPRLLRLN